MNDDSWVIIDTETDGLRDPIHVVEIAAQRMKGWKRDGEPFQVFLNHDVPMSESVIAIHGYTQKFLRKHGIKPKDAHEKFRGYVGDLPIVAHNLAFDWNRALVPEWKRLRIKQIGERGLCSVTLSRRVIDDAKNYKLQTLKDHFHIQVGRHHHALNDVEVVVQLFENVLGSRLEPLGIETFKELAAFSKKTPVAKCLAMVRDVSPEPQKKPKKKVEADEWYYMDADKNTHGPHPASFVGELAGGEACYVWREGLRDWVLSIEESSFVKYLKDKIKNRKIKKKATPSKSIEELKGLCMGIMADGIVTADEIMCLSNWLQEAGRIDEWPASEISQAVEDILEDGIITPDEQEYMANILRGLNLAPTVAGVGTQATEEVPLKFDCPSCGQRLEGTVDMCGMTVDCPVCGQRMIIPTEAVDCN